MTQQKLNWGVIGCGVIANEMAQGLEKMGHHLYSIANRTHEKAVAFAEKYGVERVFLFGSMARGDANENSDYDFLITKGNLKSLVQYMSFISELENILHSHVDVITDSSPDEDIIKTAQEEGILLYER